MAFCPRCGAVLDEGLRFCTSCGSDLAAARREPAPAPAAPPPPAQAPPPPAAAPPPAWLRDVAPSPAPPAAPPRAPPAAPMGPLGFLRRGPKLGSSSPSDVPAAGMPDELRQFVVELEEWARLNHADARKDTIRFWILKIPAVVSSASAGVLALGELTAVAAVLAAVASACVLIDGVNPGGQLRNAHLRAVHELRALQHEIVNGWRMGTLQGRSGNALAATLLEQGEIERKKIANDLKAAETSFEKTIHAK